MRLEDVSAQLRPRAPWESVDLGFAMVRRHFRLLLAAWSLTVVPLWILLLVLSNWIPLGWVLLIIWWLKPIYDRVPLFILSRSLFGATPKLRDVLKAWPAMLYRNFFRIMLLRVPWIIAAPRFSWARTLLLPVIDLEQQKGRGFSERQKVLLAQAGGTATSLVMFCAMYETLLTFGLLTLVASMLADPLGATQFGEVFLDGAFRKGELSGWLEWSFIGGYLAAMTMVELFFVGGGFGLYLNCRTHLEGWDVEIVFRRLAQRLTHAAGIVLVGALLFLGSPAHAALEKADKTEKAEKAEKADKADDPAKDTIERVMAHEDFKVHKQIIKEPVDTFSSSGTGGGGFSAIAGLGQVLFYGFLAFGIGWLIWIIYKNRDMFARGAPVNVAKPSAPRTLMGMDISPDSLPDDIAGAARQRWLAGDARGALSLLYRGSLVWLVHVARLSIRESDTEGDCLRHSSTLPEPVRRDYFSMLTGEWVDAAYAERLPGQDRMETLLQSWPFANSAERRAR